MKKHLLKVGKMPTVAAFESTEWTERKPYVGLVGDSKAGGGVFYNYEPIKLPDGYVWAKDNDFRFKDTFPMGGSGWHYIGKADKVAIPHVIHGKEVTSYSNMFYGTSVSGVYSDNPNITNMQWMFYESRATSLDLSSFDTSNVTDMRYMFSESRATALDLSSFDTRNVTDMSYMFSYSEAATLDLSSFDTSNVTNMTEMFRNSKSTTLDLSGFNTSSVNTMYGMFWGSKSTTLDLSSFDTSKVTNMRYMFGNSNATEGYARTQEDADRFNNSSDKPAGLEFIVKPKTN